MPVRDDAGDTIAKIGQLRDQIKKHDKEHPMKSFHITDTRGTKERTRTGGGSGAGAGVAGPAGYAELRAHGYEVKSEIVMDASGDTFEPLLRCGNPLLLIVCRTDARPPDAVLHSHRVSTVGPDKELVAKKVRKGLNELEILKFLDSIQPKSEHVILLLDSFHTQSGPWVILSKMDTVADYLEMANQLDGRAPQVCLGLIKGLAYLHKHCIAHRNIKPDNLVVDQDFSLKMID